MPDVPEIRFASGHAARGIPFELHNNHIYLRVGVNNSEPLSFILDTGASSLINRRRVESLGLKLRRGGRGYGVGENSIEAASVGDVTLHLPGVSLARQSLAAIPLEGLQSSLGRPVDGILGYSFFRRLVVEIDYDSRIINLYSPMEYRHRGRGGRIPLIVDEDSGLIFARAQIKPLNRAPINGLFEIDSGGGHALILNSPFVERHHLLTPAQRANPVSVGGVVGSSNAVEGVAESLRLGRAHVENVGTFFSLAREGMLASDEFDGNIGNDVLRRFKVILNYSRRLMILEPNQ
ncbi:MAG TPA: aspartyl protease family protein [Pyrinomonadaceae bacterium]|jgi:hypothetical protein